MLFYVFHRKTKKSTEYYFYIPSQKIKAKGKHNSASQKVGKWSYFYEDGKRCGTAHFSKTGRKIGVWKYYKTDGSIDRIIKIKNKKFGMLQQKGKPKTELPLAKILEPLSIEI